MKNTEKDGTQKQKASTHPEPPNRPVESSVEPFSRLGAAAPLLRIALAGVKFPVESVQDLHEKTRSERRLLKFADGCGLAKLYSIKDILAAIPELEDKMPLQTQEELIDWIAKTEKMNASKGKGDGKAKAPQLLCRIGADHLNALLSKPKMFSKSPPWQINPVSPKFIDDGPYRDCSNVTVATTADDPCRFKLSARDSETTLSSGGAPLSISNLENEYANLEQGFEDFIRDLDPAKIADLEHDADDVCEYADDVRTFAEQALELARSAYCDAKYINEHRDEYADVYFRAGDTSCYQIDPCNPREEFNSGTLVRDEAQQCLPVWEDSDHALWQTPVKTYNDADNKCSFALEVKARLPAIASIEHAILWGRIFPPGEEIAPAGDITNVEIEVYNNSFIDIFGDQVEGRERDRKPIDQQIHVLCSREGCTDRGDIQTFGVPFAVGGNWGPSDEGPATVVIKVRIEYWQPYEEPDTIEQVWVCEVNANSISLHLHVFNFEYVINSPSGGWMPTQQPTIGTGNGTT